MNSLTKILQLVPQDIEIKPLKTREAWKKMEEETLAIAKKILDEKRLEKIIRRSEFEID